MIGYSPGATVSGIHCSIDEHVPEPQRIRLTLRILSCRQVEQIEQLLEEAGKGSRKDERTKLDEGLLMAIAGWDNCPYALTREGLGDAFTSKQKYQLLNEIPILVHLAEWEKEKKALPSPHSSGPATSAGDAAVADVMTHQHQAAKS
jgi:hypothetical protein